MLPRRYTSGPRRPLHLRHLQLPGHRPPDPPVPRGALTGRSHRAGRPHHRRRPRMAIPGRPGRRHLDRRRGPADGTPRPTATEHPRCHRAHQPRRHDRRLPPSQPLPAGPRRPGRPATGQLHQPSPMAPAATDLNRQERAAPRGALRVPPVDLRVAAVRVGRRRADAMGSRHRRRPGHVGDRQPQHFVAAIALPLPGRSRRVQRLTHAAERVVAVPLAGRSSGWLCRGWNG